MKIQVDRAALRLRPLLLLLTASLAAGSWFAAASSVLAEAQWIWGPPSVQAGAPAGSCYFRKMFNADGATGGKVEIACDDNYILYINGLKIGSGSDWRSLDTYNIGPYLTPGENVIAVAAIKSQSGPAGLVARVSIQHSNAPSADYSTDMTWKTSPEKQAGWAQPNYGDSLWVPARPLGEFGATPQWHSDAQKAGSHSQPRFEVTREFRIEWVVQPKLTGSLLAMTFNEFGQILASRENGPLLLIRDTDGDGLPDSVTTYCDQVKNCQGILALNGDVFVTADGPQGAALYRLIDHKHVGKIDEVRALVKFEGHMQEHGPHAVKLGPDGLIYVMCGNLTKLAAAPRAESPYRDSYEGDLLQPRYEDPRGFAMGVKAPGGMVLRTDIDGSFVDYFAGGLRNCYDMAFHPQGDLLTGDSDMESDEGLPWYRPTRINHVVAGAEFGWRSGWAKWPEYFVDSLGSVLDTGPGSPTGMVVYDHVMYPRRYHRALFVGDWSQGQIMVVSLNPDGASYDARSIVFAEGNPLNVTNVDVGPDGWVYFCTGGRGSEGGIYRIVWMGKVPPEVTDLGTGLTQALKQPQLNSAFARQKIAAVKKQLGAAWDTELPKAAANRALASELRTRAMDLMQLFGPFPAHPLLIELSGDRDSLVRARAASLMGMHSDDKTAARLAEMLMDPSPLVQRIVCESLTRSGAQPPAEKVLPLLASQDRYVAWAARRLVERLPRNTWEQAVLDASRPRVFLVGSIALLVTGADRPTCQKILDRCQQRMKGFVPDGDFIDLLRVCQLALIKGNFKPDELPGLSRMIAAEYPSGEPRINRELVRILAFLESPYAAQRILEQLKANPDLTEKMQLAMHSSHFVRAWNTEQRFSVLAFCEQVRTTPRGVAFGRYLDRVNRDFVAQMSDAERRVLIVEGKRFPGAALGALAKLPADLDQRTIDDLKRLDGRLISDKSDAANRLRIGLVAVLARTGEPQAMAYLRQVYENEPERRPIVAMGLAQRPDGENWPLLVRSLGVLQGSIAGEVLAQLAHADQKPDQPEPIRQVILQGLKAQDDEGRRAALALLEKWTSHLEGKPDDSPQGRLAAWQKWFAATYPQQPEAVLPKTAAADKFTMEQLEKFLSSTAASQGDKNRGADVFVRARCIACHRFGDRGEPLGPDLSTVSRRFQKKEIIESILFPSAVISDQYATKTIQTTNGRVISGLASPEPDGGLLVLLATGEKVHVAKEQIDKITTSKVSTMPTGLLNPLSLGEIADLFAYLGTPPPENLTRRQSVGTPARPR